MTDTTTIERAPQLEPHGEFEGVGAHELNPRFENVDGYTGYTPDSMPQPTALLRAQSFLGRSLAAATPPRLDGIDVSHHNYDAGPLSWQQVHDAPTVWAATKATQSIGYVDPTFVRSRQSMTAVDYRHRGIYGWLSSTTDPALQAAWFINNVIRLAPHEFAFSDAEEAGITVERLLAWLEPVEAVFQRPVGVYTGAYVAGGTIWTDPRVREGKYGPRPMLLAAYTTEAKARALPGVATHPWSSWQFSSNGPVPGVTGRVDMNRVDDFAAFDLAAGITTPINPPPVIPPETSIQGDDMPAMITNSQPHDIGDGHGPYDPGVIVWEVVEGHKVHIPNASIVKAYGGHDRAVPMDETELAAITERPEFTGEPATETRPMTFTGKLDSIPGEFTLTTSVG